MRNWGWSEKFAVLEFAAFFLFCFVLGGGKGKGLFVLFVLSREWTDKTL